MIRLILFTCLLNMLAFSAHAADYHVCSNGDDSNDGLSHDTAWQTHAKANSMFGTLLGGDSILFCKGEQFEITTSDDWDNRNSTRDNPVTISSYTPPGSADLDNPVLFTTDGQDGFSFSNGGDADHKEGFVVSDLVLRGGGDGELGYGIFIYNDTDFVTITNSEIYDFRIGIYLSRANTPSPGSDEMNSDVTVRGVYIHDNYGQGWLGGGDRLLIENSVFVNNGYELANLSHNLYLSQEGIDETIRNNWIYQSTMVDGECQGVSLVVHGIHTNLTIEDNVVWEDPDAVASSCWGIAVDNGYGSELEQFTGLTIRGNTVVNVGNRAIGCARCQDAVIEDNTIVHQAQSHGADLISAPNRDENSYPSLPQTNNVTVRNNTVFYDSPLSGVGVSLGDGDGSDYTSENNDIYYDPDSDMIAGCEEYDPGDSITVSAGICQDSIPQDLLDEALARTEIPDDLTAIANSPADDPVESTEEVNSGNTGGSVSASSSGSSSGSAIGWHHLGFLLVLLGIRSRRVHLKHAKP